MITKARSEQAETDWFDDHARYPKCGVQTVFRLPKSTTVAVANPQWETVVN